MRRRGRSCRRRGQQAPAQVAAQRELYEFAAASSGAGAGALAVAEDVVVGVAPVGAGVVLAEDAGAEDAVVGEPGDGLKLSNVELPAPAGSVSLVAAGRAAFGASVDFRPRL